MSGFMQKDDFEHLWSKRDELDEETRVRLEDEMKRDRFARDYTRGGEQLRSILLRMNDEKAAPNFSYQMGVYAKNHPDDDRGVVERPWFRWSAVSAGLASGALLMMLMLGGPESMMSPAFQSGAGSMAQPAGQVEELREATPAPVASDNELAVNSDSTANSVDSTARRSSHPVPSFELQRVSTAE